MADQPLAPPPSGESLEYRPLSGFALAGFVLSLLFAGLVLVSALVALAQGVPFFFPPWLLLLAGAGLVLSLVGQSQIKSAEGTRAGLALARTGVWVSVFTGLGYFAYYYVTGLALTGQANAFLMDATDPSSGFFPRLQKGATDPAQLNAAFLLTLPATERGGTRPDDERALAERFDPPSQSGSPGPLGSFKIHFLVRAFGKGPENAVTVEPLGVQAWGYENRSYKVKRNYRLRSPALEMEVLIPVQSTEGEAAGQARQWFVALPQIERGKDWLKFTPLGNAVSALRAQARVHVEDVLHRLNEGTSFPDFGKIDQTDWARTVPARVYRDTIQKRTTEAFLGTGKYRLGIYLAPHDNIGDWYKDGPRVVIEHPWRLSLMPDGDFPGAMLDGKVVTRTRDPIDLDKVGDDPVPWDLIAIRFVRGTLGDPRKAGPPAL